jgi:hypothetical protein
VACASNAPATTSSCRSSASNRRWHETNHSVCSWRAGCGGSHKPGSEGGGEETIGRKADTGASPPTLRERARQAVPQDCSLANRQEPSPALLIVVRSRRVADVVQKRSLSDGSERERDGRSAG